MNPATLHSFTNRQHGLVTREQAAAAGWSKSAWYRALNAGLLAATQPDVARLPGSPVTPVSRVLAVTLSIGPGAVASHRSAAMLWGAPLDGEVVDVIVHGGGHPRRAGAVVHRTLIQEEIRPRRRVGVPTVGPLRALLDLGAVAPEAVGSVLTAFAQARLVSPSAARAALDRHSARGRRGLGALRRALDEWALGVRPPDSELEEVFGSMLVRFGLPTAEFQRWVHGYRVDFFFGGRRLIVECDGWEWHGVARDRFESDRRRDAELGAAGYIVRRFSWFQICHRQAWVASIVRAHLNLLGPGDLATAPSVLTG